MDQAYVVQLWKRFSVAVPLWNAVFSLGGLVSLIREIPVDFAGGLGSITGRTTLSVLK
mgnify:FL=1